MIRIIPLTIRFILWGIFMVIGLTILAIQWPIGWLSRRLKVLINPNEALVNMALILILVWTLWIINEILFWVALIPLFACNKLTPKNQKTINQKFINEIIEKRRRLQKTKA